MPQINDASWAYENLSADAGISIPLPSNDVNNLLVAFVMGDTGAPTWTLPSGWTQLFARNNTVSTLCAYKISNGSEPTSVTFGATVNETYNGCIISIKDVNTTNPFGNPAIQTNTTQVAANKFNMPSITTNVDNALCLIFSANQYTAVPSFIEGIAHSIVAADGFVESMGVGWFFKKTAGVTSSTISCSNVISGVGVVATIQIAPPSSGATIIPAYISNETSLYLDPINGVTAYNTNTALAATADTNFGTTLGGITAADATVAEAVDTGINSFHSTGQLTTVANATSIHGAELVFATANRPNLTGVNLLLHCQTSTAGQLQRLTSIKSNKGVWFGMRSGAATNYKIWQVLGYDSLNSANRFIPIIINEQATNTKASAGTLAPSSILSTGVWVGGTAQGTVSMQFASLWAMGTTTICGGNQSGPVDIKSIVLTAADYHERKSVILQGSNQMLVLQELQFGNGGTDPIYLDLNSTAIEFPSQYNINTKLVSYNSVDNKIGLFYNAGSTDTIIHNNSIISSPNKYYWGFHPSSSLTANYNFSGLQVIGAGNVYLNRNVPIDGINISNYGLVYAQNCNLSNSTFDLVPSTNDSIEINTTSSFNACTFNCSTLNTGSYLLSTSSPSIFQNCQFNGSNSSHAIRITSAGTYSFNGNQFSNFNINNTSGSAIFNDSGGTVTLNISNGSTPTYRNSTGSTTIINNTIEIVITGLKDDTEVRIYESGTTNELAGIETVIDGSANNREFAFNISPSTIVDIVIISLLYQNIRINNYTIPLTNSSIPIQQLIDRYYNNI